MKKILRIVITTVALLSASYAMCKSEKNMEPKIVELDEFSVVGFQTFANPAEGAFGKMWGILNLLQFDGYLK